MMEKQKLNIIKKIIWLRLAQVLINERYKNGDFKIPIHLALGHETIAVSVDAVMQEQDALFLTHRNVHYNLARMGSLKEELDEYYLKETGLAKGHLGSMNLANPENKVIYSSSILGNNLPVGSGFALGNKAKKNDGVTFIVTGDGALEEGAFYETLLFLSANQLPVVIIVENNEWSLGTKIDERRNKIDLKKLTDSVGVDYLSLQDNDPFDYLDKLESCRSTTLASKVPILIEVKLTTLGYWYLKNKDNPEGKFINYHAGPAPEVEEKGQEYPLILSSNSDPLFPLTKYLSMADLTGISNELSATLKEDIS
jgi:TPP-dependent pyruvate/acetoin dehydrogenase alpha subunit